ncbi:MAG: NPCBM/NEW2 domain-containing protein [Phycisphaerales bacterium]|nr:NPCBM/NEW2 domain-containing protein [Phycisphaerales bacterium]
MRIKYLAIIWISNAAALHAVVAPSSRSEMEIRLLDGRTMRGDWLGWTPTEGLRLATAEGETRVAADDLLAITSPVPAEARVGPAARMVRLWFHDGGAADVRMGDSVDATVNATTRTDQPLAVPYAQLAAIQYQRPGDCPEGDEAFRSALAARLPGEDVLISCDGGEVRSVRGVLESLSAETGTFRHQDRTRTFQTARLYGLVLAAQTGRKQSPSALVTTTEGDAWPGELLGAEGPQLVLRTSFNATLKLDIDRLARVDFFSDRVTHLGDLAPTAVREEARLLTPSPFRKDRSAANTPLKLGGRTYEHGVGVHAFSELTYDLGGAYQTFYAVVGIDDLVRPRGSAAVRILGDGTTLYDSDAFSGKDEPSTIRVDVSGVKTLMLVADCGDGLDLADFVDWADARLIRASRDAR